MKFPVDRSSSQTESFPESCEQLHARMIAFDTVNARYTGRTSGETALAVFLEIVAQHWGLKTERLGIDQSDNAATASAEEAFNLFVGNAPLTASGEWLLFDSHLDTVSVAGMTVPPFEATRCGSRIHGRGACDTKGSGAAMLWALREAVKKHTLRNIGIFFTVDEEAGMTGAASLSRTVLRNRNADAPVRGVIIGEPTDMQPVVAHNGLLRLTLVTRGVAAHSSEPSRGRSAISAMLRVVDALEKNYAPMVATRTNPLTGGAAASVNVIRGGTQVNVIPERCEIEVDRRLTPQENPEAALREIKEFLDTLAKNEPALALASASGVEQIVDPNILAPVDFSAPASQAFHAWVSGPLANAGIDTTPRGARYATNGSHYVSAGLPVIIMGPGNIAQAHTADEWLDVTQLELAARIYGALMMRE